MKKRATLADIAKIAGVTMMTVSRVINNKPGISQETRQRILQIANEVDYHPNQIARGLATNQTKTIGLVVPDITNPFFAHMARGVEDQAYELGYSILMINTAEDTTRERNALDSLWSKDVDGLILSSSRLADGVLQKQVERFPAVVLVNRAFKITIPSVISVIMNDQRGAQLAMEYFLSHGRRSIAHLCGPVNSISAQKRIKGYQQTLEMANFQPKEGQLIRCSPDTASGYAAARVLLTEYPETDAIYAFNDLVAVGALQYCLEIGKQVPGEIAIIGNDDIPLASILRPRLSTLHINQNDVGRLTLRTLVEIITGQALPSTITIEPELILRESA